MFARAKMAMRKSARWSVVSSRRCRRVTCGWPIATSVRGTCCATWTRGAPALSSGNTGACPSRFSRRCVRSVVWRREKWPSNGCGGSMGRVVRRRSGVCGSSWTTPRATALSILTNVPARTVSAKRVARLYRTRWTLETAFQPLEAYFHAAINTLAYPKAALFGFCLAVVASNSVAVVLAALRGVHGQESVDEEVSLSSIATDIATTYHGMMIAIPEVEWDVFARMRTSDMVATLLDLARRVNLRAYRKSPRGPKKPRPKCDGSSKQGHGSTAKLLMARHG